MTSYLAVFGNPIEHSLSPVIHNYFAKICSIDLQYDKILVQKGGFDKAADDFLERGLGFNITQPFKLDALNYAKKRGVLSKAARAAGAVNTIAKLKDGRIFGDTTDGYGLVLDLKRLQMPTSGAKCLLIGAGGAARGIISSLFTEGGLLSMVICNRTHQKAVDVASFFANSGFKVTAAPEDRLEGHFDIIINASSSSLHKTLPNIKDEVYKGAAAAYDLMYTKEEKTIFTEHLKSLGVCSYDGLGMLVAQAAGSFEIWHGILPDISGTLSYLRAYLKNA